MLRRLKRWIRNWLDDDKSDDDRMVCTITGVCGPEQREYRVIGAVGTHLVGIRPPPEDERRLISAEQCPDVERFWRLWRRYCGDVSQWHWESGKPFRPWEDAR
jgi:hypothetical protein